MAFDPKALLFAVVAAAAAASLGLSSYFFHKMIREVNEADGQPGSSRWPLVFRGSWYVVIRHEQVCPKDESTRYLYFVLGLAGFGFAVLATRLWGR